MPAERAAPREVFPDRYVAAGKPFATLAALETWAEHADGARSIDWTHLATDATGRSILP